MTFQPSMIFEPEDLHVAFDPAQELALNAIMRELNSCGCGRACGCVCATHGISNEPETCREHMEVD